MLKFAAAATAALIAATSAAPTDSDLPIVDLDYELHQASNLNETTNIYAFTNIRYAAPPISDLRFSPPSSPAKNRETIQTGSSGHTCPQATGAWSSHNTNFLAEYTQTFINNETEKYIAPAISSTSEAQDLAGMNNATSEDCLFLDVWVPEKVFNRENKKDGGAAVLVWIHGGGYISGSKDLNDPSGLINTATNGTEDDDDEGIVFVTLNYRLGVFGWLSGPSFSAQGGIPNLGLLDQRFALQWVREHIGKFGGDPDRVTVMGESAGGGSVMHQITAFGGVEEEGGLFERAIVQSPALIPVPTLRQQEDAYAEFLNLTGVGGLEELRGLDEDVLVEANALQVWAGAYGTFVYGPVVDGDFVPQTPSLLLSTGKFNQSLCLVVGTNQMEGEMFTQPYTGNAGTEAIEDVVHDIFPYISPSSLSHITEVMYPEASNSTPYDDNLQRATRMTAELYFECNALHLTHAFKNRTHNYLFNDPLPLHGFDVAHTFYNAEPEVGMEEGYGVKNRRIAEAMQGFFTSFAKDGRPAAEGVDEFPMFTGEGKVLELGEEFGVFEEDRGKIERCAWWAKALYA